MTTLIETLKKEPAPRHLLEAVNLLGTVEYRGNLNNPAIVKWADEIGGWVGSWYTDDSIPWCGLYVAVALKRAGRDSGLKNPLGALNWAQYGVKVDVPELADILVFKRPGGGHVGFYVGEDAEAYWVLGGNQSDSVNVTRLAKSRLVAARRVPYNNKPTNIRRIFLKASGALSTNEA